MSEEIIGMGNRKAIEVIKCDLCGKLTLPKDDVFMESQFVINGYEFKAIITNKEFDEDHDWLKPKYCSECRGVFEDSMYKVKEMLANREKLYTQEVLIRNATEGENK